MTNGVNASLGLAATALLFVMASSSATAAAPEAPAGLSATAPIEQQAMLKWSAVSGAASYDIYRGTDSGGETEVATDVPTNFYEDSSGTLGLGQGTVYYYEVTAVNGDGDESGKSNEVSVVTQPPEPGSAPTPATAGDAQVTLNWLPVPSATGYHIYRDTMGIPGGTTNFVVTGTLVGTGTQVVSYTDTGLTNGVNYDYIVTTLNSSGENPNYILITATPAAATNSEAPTGPPTGLTAVAGTSQVQLRWLPAGNASSYDIFRGTNSGGETLFKSGVTATKYTSGPSTAIACVYTDTSATNGTTYYYKVRADNGGQSSSLSNEASALPQTPTVPANISAAPGSNQVVLTWTATGSSYAIYRGTTPGTEVLYDSGLTGNTFTDAAAANGATYYYEVQSLNAGGSSPLSAEVSATPSGPAPQAWTGTISFSLPGEPLQTCTASIADVNRPVPVVFMSTEGPNMQSVANKYNALVLGIDGFTEFNFGTAANPIYLNTPTDTDHPITIIDYRWPGLSALRIQAALTAAAQAVPGHPEIQYDPFMLYGFSEGTDNNNMAANQPALANRLLAGVDLSELDEDHYNPIAVMDTVPHLFLASGLYDAASTLNASVQDISSVLHDTYTRALATSEGAPLTTIDNVAAFHGSNPDHPFITIWLDSILSQRLPATVSTSGPVSLPSWQNRASWVGSYDVTTSTQAPWGVSGNTGVELINDAVSTESSYSGARPVTWLPSENTAHAWLAYASSGYQSSLAPVNISAATATVTANRAFAYQVLATNVPTDFSANTLPQGLSFDATNGLITGTLTSVSSNTLTIGAANSSGSGTATLTLKADAPTTETFTQWEQGLNYAGTALATPENDGVSNLQKYVFDIDPAEPMTASDRAALPMVATGTISGQAVLTLNYREYASETGVTIHVQTSANLSTWTTISQPTIVQTGSDPTTGDPLEQVQVPVSGRSQFIRLYITMP